MAGQINLGKGSTYLTPPEGYRGYAFDGLGNPVIIKEDGTTELLVIAGSSSNITANRGVGLLADLPLDPIEYDVYVTTDTLSIYVYTNSSWVTNDLDDKQFITDSSSSVKVLYQLITGVLFNLTVIEIDALDVNFNPVPGITSTNVQSAIEEIYSVGAGVSEVNGDTGPVVVLDADDIDDTTTTNKFTTQAEADKLAGVEAGAEVNNISDANATDLTDAGDSALHYHSADRDRSNHTGVQSYTTISGFNFVNLSDVTLTTPTAGDGLIIDSDNSTVVNVGTEEFDYIIKNKSLNITDDYQLLFDLIQNYKIDFILIENNTANTMVLNIGSTSTGNDIVSAKSIPASGAVLIEGSEILKSFFSLTSDTELHLSDNGAGWNSASINVYFSFQKISE